MSDKCGSTDTTTGEPCKNDAESCPWHDTDDPPDTGRNSKLTKERQEGMAAMVEQGHSQAAAARAYGITPQTFTEWKNRGKEEEETIYAEFAERIARALSQSETDYVNSLRHIAEEIQDPNTLRWMLQQRFNDSWGESDALGGDSKDTAIKLPESVVKEWQR